MADAMESCDTLRMSVQETEGVLKTKINRHTVAGVAGFDVGAAVVEDCALVDSVVASF